VPKKNVKSKTPIRRDIELNMYSNKKVFFNISKYCDVSSKKLIETVKIGIITRSDTKNELRNHILNLLKNI
tara:strand:+ start:129 stop:341 length:213 start_codon:yes stop_codon:yes gene_type:complete